MLSILETMGYLEGAAYFVHIIRQYVLNGEPMEVEEDYSCYYKLINL